MVRRLLRSEPQYATALFGLALFVVLFFTYVFPHELAASPLITRFVDMVANVVPVLADLQRHVPPYTPYWGLFYAVLWAMAPIWLIMGWLAVFHLSESKTKMLMEINGTRFFIICIICALSLLFLLKYPPYSFFNILGDNEGITFRQLIYVSLIAGLWYAVGELAGAYALRNKFKSKE